MTTGTEESWKIGVCKCWRRVWWATDEGKVCPNCHSQVRTKQVSEVRA